MIGAQTVTFVSMGNGALDRKNIATQVPTRTVVCGCQLMPTAAKEDVTNVSYAVDNYTLLAPPYPAVLATKPDDIVIDAAGSEYHVIGTLTFPNANGSINYVQVMLWQPSGLNAPPSVAY